MAERLRLHTVVVGLSWRTASSAVRDRCHVPADLVPDLLRQVQETGVEEVVLLSTCNRIEFWMAASQPEEAIRKTIAVWDASLSPGEEWRRSLQCLTHEEAARHVFSVASSLESLVMGETQIPSQVRSAWDRARAEGRCGWFLTRLIQAALAAAKKVRSSTRLGEGATSVAGAAVDLARRAVGKIAERGIAVVGAGEMAELAVTGFVRAGAVRFTYLNRTLEKVERLQTIRPGEAATLEALPRILEKCDVLISATAASGFVIGRDAVSQAMKRRRTPLFLLDIAAPRDIDPECARVEGVFLYGIDDLEQVVDRTRRSRGDEALQAQNLLDAEATAFCDWVRGLSIVPLLAEVRGRIHDLARGEVERFLPRMARALEAGDERALLEDFAQALANKFLHNPTVGARKASVEGREIEVASALRELFLQESG